MSKQTQVQDDLECVRQAGVLTGRYSAFKPEMGTPVRTSVGMPKFWRHGPLPHARACSPYGVFNNKALESEDDMKAAYRLRLSAFADDVVAELAAIAREHPGKPLVLLCYEDVEKDYCHRTELADWLHERFGLIVTEVQ